MRRTATFGPPSRVSLEYGSLVPNEIISSLSGVAAHGDLLFTVADESRTVEILRARDGAYVLEARVELDDVFPGLPKGHEADLEGLDVAGGKIWLCGSHCRTRWEAAKDGTISPGFRRRPSRHLLGSLDVAGLSSDPIPEGYAIPALGEGSLRRRLRDDPVLAPFLNLPTKENGLDVEGLALLGNRMLLGLRGPVMAGLGVVVELRLRKDGEISGKGPCRHLLDLEGLGIRDMAREGADILVLAGPVTAASGPFRVHRWTPGKAAGPERPQVLGELPHDNGKPEGMCVLDRNGRSGLLIVYDSPGKNRLDGRTYQADWFGLPGTHR